MAPSMVTLYSQPGCVDSGKVRQREPGRRGGGGALPADECTRRPPPPGTGRDGLRRRPRTERGGGCHARGDGDQAAGQRDLRHSLVAGVAGPWVHPLSSDVGGARAEPPAGPRQRPCRGWSGSARPPSRREPGLFTGAPCWRARYPSSGATTPRRRSHHRRRHSGRWLIRARRIGFQRVAGGSVRSRA